MGGAADAARGGDGGTTLRTDAAVDVAGVARGATENAVCNGVSQLRSLRGTSNNYSQPYLTGLRHSLQ